ncbi:MAG: rod shape-determining protein RodA [Candidatus Omnitrophica bacterium]|nr:rod shape-determining protein RodA [Candidatus Omnitrophota bacterium]
MSSKLNFRNLDKGLFAAPILIFLIGVFSVYSASFKSRELLVHTLVVKQILWMGIGILLVFLILRVNTFRLRDWAWPLYFVSVFLLVAVLFTPPRLGARRWIDLGGFNFQPSELAKLSVILVLAHLFSHKRVESLSKRDRLMPFIIVGVPFLLILKEPDLGTAVILVPIFLAMLYGWGFRARALLIFLAIGVLASPLLFFFLKDYQRTRLLVFMNPNLDPLGAGYTIIQSKIAIGSGGLLGRGFMGGTQTHLQFLPEKHTDFIFSVVAEEGGLAACLALLFLFGVIVKKGYALCGQTPDRFGSGLACGITTMIGFQAFINIGMTMGLLPVVGVPLPLVSYGGTSVITTMLAIGLLLNIHLHKPLF